MQYFAHGVLDSEICDLLYEVLLGTKQSHHHHHEGDVAHHPFAVNLAVILKGGPQEQAVLLTSLCSPDHAGVLPEHLVKVSKANCVSLCIFFCNHKLFLEENLSEGDIVSKVISMASFISLYQPVMLHSMI